MAVPFGFSVGDFITLGKVLNEAAGALKQSGGAADRFQNVVSDFQVWCTILDEIVQLTSSATVAQDVNAIKGQAQALRKCLRQFLDKIMKYNATLGSDAPLGFRHGAISKIKWATMVEKDVNEFRQSITLPISSLQMLFQMMVNKQNRLSYTAVTDLERSLQVMRLAMIELESKLTKGFQQSARTMFPESLLAQSELTSKLDLSMTEIHSLRNQQCLLRQNDWEDSHNRPSSIGDEPKTPPEKCRHHLENAGTENKISTMESLNAETQIHLFLRLMCRVLHRILAAFLKLVLISWPQLYLVLQASVRLSKSITAYSVSECIRFEDVFNRTHFLPIQYFRHWDLLTQTMLSYLSEGQGNRQLLERVRAGKFRIFNKRMEPMTANAWVNEVRPGVWMSMFVVLDALQSKENASNGQRCPVTHCSGNLWLSAPETSRCNLCSKVYHLAVDNVAENTKSNAQDNVVTSEHVNVRLKDLLFSTQDPILRRVMRSTNSFKEVHGPFQQFRREIAERFILHCHQRIGQFEKHQKLLLPFFNAVKLLKHKVDGTVIGPKQSSQLAVSSLSGKSTAVSVNRNNSRRYLYLSGIPYITGMPYSHARDVVKLNLDTARIRQREKKSREMEELTEIEPYHNICLSRNGDQIDSDFVNAVRSKDTSYALSILIQTSEFSGLKGLSLLQLALLSGNGAWVDCLLETGVNPFSKAENNENAFESAVVGQEFAIVLSMLTAATTLWAEYPKSEVVSQDAFAEGIGAALARAVSVQDQLMVELFLFFGADPFRCRTDVNTGISESAFELSMKLGLEDIVATFLCEAMNRQILSVVELFSVVQSMCSAKKESLISLPKSLGGNMLFRRGGQKPGYRSANILQFLEQGDQNFSASFAHSPLVITATLATSTIRSSTLEDGIIKPLQRLRSYFEDNQTKEVCLVNRVLQCLDHALISVTEILDDKGMCIDVVNHVLESVKAEYSSASLFEQIESLHSVILAVDSKFPLASVPMLDRASCWRLQVDGFLYIMKVLTALKHQMRQLRLELVPLWRRFLELRHQAKRTHTIRFRAASSALFPENKPYVLTIRLKKGADRNWFIDSMDINFDSETMLNVSLEEIDENFLAWDRLRYFRQIFGKLPSNHRDEKLSHIAPAIEALCLSIDSMHNPATVDVESFTAAALLFGIKLEQPRHPFRDAAEFAEFLRWHFPVGTVIAKPTYEEKLCCEQCSGCINLRTSEHDACCRCDMTLAIVKDFEDPEK